MMNNLADSITGYLVKSQIINRENMEIYSYGIKAFGMQAIHMMVMIAIGGLFSMPLIAVEFIFFYSMLRTVAGGQHFSSKKLCFLSSCILMILVVMFCQHYPVLGWRAMNLIGFGCCSIIIWILAPCDNANKPMNEKEKHYYARKTKMVILLLSVIYLISIYKQWRCAYVILISMLFEAIGIVWGTLENYCRIEQRDIKNGK